MKQGTYQFFNADCMNKENGLPSYSDKYFDLAICDISYGHKRFNRPDCLKNNIGESRLRKYGHTDFNIVPNKKEYFDELFRISKNQILWGANYFNQFLPNSQGWIFWFKHQPVSNFAEGEFAYTSFDIPAKCFDYSYFGTHGADKDRIHPTQKPIALYKWLLSKYAKEGDKILDSHAGSCSSVIACIDMGYDIVAFEKDIDYYNMAQKRIDDYLKQQVMDFKGGL